MHVANACCAFPLFPPLLPFRLFSSLFISPSLSLAPSFSLFLPLSPSVSLQVEIDDCTFHRCVRLGKFDADRTITFIPPDGEFELMKFRVTDNVNLPFRVLPVVEEHGAQRVSYNIKVIANFSPKLFATNVVFTIPVPPNTARCKFQPQFGKAKYEPELRCIKWRIKRFPGGSEYVISPREYL